jgi:hypothetical protein
MKDLRNYTVKEFAEIINEKAETIANLMRANVNYTNKPFESITETVKNSNVAEENKEIVADFIYANIFNRPAHRTYSTRGYSVTLRG